MPHLFDAHCHYHDLDPAAWGRIGGELRRIGLGGAVVNGAYPQDWDAVDAFTRANPELAIVRSYGVHPWHLHRIECDDDWLDELRRRLEADPRAKIGEIGIDHLKAETDADRERQSRVMLAQLDEAALRDVPATVHCVRAHEALWSMIEHRGGPRRGWLLHAWSGPAHLVGKFAERGAYFSFSACTLTRRNPRASIRTAPLDRILIETDAPYMIPPASVRTHELHDTAGEPINHPANIVRAYELAAAELTMDVESLATRIAENFARLFRD